jgi:predicted transcriptional regulator
VDKKMGGSIIQRLVVCSDLRKEIIFTLYESQKSLGDIRDSLKISATTAIHALKELEKGNLTFQDKNKNYCLTNIGRIIAMKMLDFSNSAEVLNKHEKFWMEHDLSGIPEFFFDKIGSLKDSLVLKDTDTDIFKVHTNFINLLKNAKEIKGVSSIYVPEFVSLFEELNHRNVDIQLVLTTEVLGKIDMTLLNKIDKNKSNVKLFVMDKNIKAAITVTDSFFSLGLFRMDGTYDYSNDLVSQSQQAIAMGKEIFNHYVKLSKRII